MRKVLIVVFGLVSLGALAMQPASASIGAMCVNIAQQRCIAAGDQCTTSDQYLALQRQCVTEFTVKAAVAKQQKQDYINHAQTPTGIIGGGKPKLQSK
jgi:hypothetical protein